VKGKIKKVSQTDLKYKKIKLLTKCMLNPNVNSYILEEDKTEFNNTLKFRMFNHLLGFPKVIKYVNEYLNNLYDFNKHCPNYWIKTFAEILRSYGVNKPNQLYYPKFKVSQRDNFFKIVREYNNSFNQQLNLKEMDCIYQLYNNRIISNHDLEGFKLIGNGCIKGSIKVNDPIKVDTPIKSNNNEFIDSIKDHISKRLPCKKYCKSFNKENVIIKTNADLNESEIDLRIIELSPSREEILSNTFPLDDIIKEQFNDIPNFKYLYTHILLCETDIGLSITQLKDSIKICSEVNRVISNQFPSKFNLILGDKAKKAYGIKLPMTQCYNKVLNGNCIILPSLEEYSMSKMKRIKFAEGITFIHDLIKDNKSNEQLKNIELPEDQKIERIEKGWLLWDTQILENGSILYTFTNHETMEKKYIHNNEISFPIYIKKGFFRDCDYITSNTEDITYLNSMEKQELNQQLNFNIRKIIKNVNISTS